MKKIKSGFMLLTALLVVGGAVTTGLEATSNTMTSERTIALSYNADTAQNYVYDGDYAVKGDYVYVDSTYTTKVNKAGVYVVGNTKYVVNSSGKKVERAKTGDYIFIAKDSSCVATTDYVEYDGNDYYTINGVVAKGIFQLENGKTIYANESTGIIKAGKVTYKKNDYVLADVGNGYSKGEMIEAGFVTSEGEVYLEDEITALEDVDDTIYYVVDGKMQSEGVTTLSNGMKIFTGESTGKVFKTRVTAKNGKVYLPTEWGQLITGFINEDGEILETVEDVKDETGEVYYTIDGLMKKGLITVDESNIDAYIGKKIFLGEGTYKLWKSEVTARNGKTYLPDETGMINVSSVDPVDSGYRFINEDGEIIAADDIEDENGYVYIVKNGVRQTGVVTVDGDKYFAGENTGRVWTSIVTSKNGTTYIPDENGKLTDGWVTVDGESSSPDETGDVTYYTKKGVVQKGVVTVDGSKYFLGETTGKLWRTKVTALDGTVYVPSENDNYALVTGKIECDGNEYYTKKGVMLKGTFREEGTNYTTNASGVIIDED